MEVSYFVTGTFDVEFKGDCLLPLLTMYRTDSRYKVLDKNNSVINFNRLGSEKLKNLSVGDTREYELNQIPTTDFIDQSIVVNNENTSTYFGFICLYKKNQDDDFSVKHSYTPLE